MKAKQITPIALALSITAACNPAPKGDSQPDKETPSGDDVHQHAGDAPHAADQHHGEDQNKNPSNHQGMTEAGSPPTGPDIVPDKLRPPLAELLPLYDGIRRVLAQDNVDTLEAPAKKLADHIARTKVKAPPDLKKHLEAIEQAAVAMGKTHADLEAARIAFGELSRPVVGLMSRSPSLAHGQHLFTCPMAKGYEKWIQPMAEIKNPYMGTKMLACGSEIPWTDSPTKG